jgi:predicted MPP superfamily phosphohydrolase
VEALDGRYPSYYVSGNHDIWTKESDRIKDNLRKFGVKVLEGDFKTVNIGDQIINICGLDDPAIDRYKTLAPSYNEQFQGLKTVQRDNIYTILLAHRPELFEAYVKEDFDLILSGHAHGGHWRIPKILNGIKAVDQGWFPRYAGGIYQSNNSTMVVSRGLAKKDKNYNSRRTTKFPRIHNRPELVIVNLGPE